MAIMNISENSNSEDLEQIASAINELTGLPTMMRSLNRKGIRIERGQVVERNYTDPVLEEVLETNKTISTFPVDGAYRGKPVVVSPIRTKECTIIAAIGVVDFLALLDLFYFSKN